MAEDEGGDWLSNWLFLKAWSPALSVVCQVAPKLYTEATQHSALLKAWTIKPSSWLNMNLYIRLSGSPTDLKDQLHVGWWTWLKQKTSPIGEKLHCSGKILCNATHDFDVLGILINGSCSHWNNDDDDDGDDNDDDHDDDGDSNVDEDDLFLIFARLGHSWHPDEWKLLL